MDATEDLPVILRRKVEQTEGRRLYGEEKKAGEGYLLTRKEEEEE
jgi:hypothetical protein